MLTRVDHGVLEIRWDEWVPEERLNKYNEENIRKQKALIEQQRARDAAEREAQKALEAETARRNAAAAAAGTSAGVSSGGGTTGGSLAGMAGGAGVAGGMAAMRRDDKRNVKRGREGEGVSVFLFFLPLSLSAHDCRRIS
jgi:mortality factor 4-like protein 1